MEKELVNLSVALALLTFLGGLVVKMIWEWWRRVREDWKAKSEMTHKHETKIAVHEEKLESHDHRITRIEDDERPKSSTK